MITLPIKKQWFDIILSGEKKEEYRDYTPYYLSRFEVYFHERITIRLRNEYRKDSRSAICEVIPRYKTGRIKWDAYNKPRIIENYLGISQGINPQWLEQSESQRLLGAGITFILRYDKEPYRPLIFPIPFTTWLYSPDKTAETASGETNRSENVSADNTILNGGNLF